MTLIAGKISTRRWEAEPTRECLCEKMGMFVYVHVYVYVHLHMSLSQV